MTASLPPRRPGTSIGSRLFFLVGVGMILPVVTLGGMGASIVSSLRGQIFVDREQWARAVADRVDELLRADLALLQQIPASPGFDLEDGLSDGELAAVRAVWLQFHSSDDVLLLDATGALVHQEPGQPRPLPAEAVAAALQALGTDRPLITGLIEDPGGEEPHVYAFVPLRNWELEPVGVVGLASQANGTRLSVIVEAARPGAEGTADLLDAQAHIVASTDPERAAELTPHRKLIQGTVARHETVVGTCSGCHRHGPLARQHEIVASVALRSAPWLIRTRQPETRAMALARTAPGRLLGIAAVLLALSLAFAFGISRSVRRPLALLTSAAEGIAAGDLTRPIPSLRRDEIGRLGRSLERMRVALRDSLDRIAHAKDELEDRVEERTQQLAAANRELHVREEGRLQLLRKVMTAQEDERRRIARELHDETSQVLAALMLRIDTALSSPDGGSRATLEEVKAIGVRALDEVHRLVLDLRPSVLDDLGLLSGIRWIAEHNLRPAGIGYRCEFDVDRRLSPEVETCCFRVAQEAITNVARHAQASSVLIQVAEREGKLVLEIEDDGRGFEVEEVSRPDARRVSFGLLGMRERVELLGGTVTIESAPGEGTRVAAEIPIAGGA